MTEFPSILSQAPKMPDRFYGSVTYIYEFGRVVTAKVEQSFKPLPKPPGEQ